MARNLPPAALKTPGIDDPKSDAVSCFHRLRSLKIEGGFLDGCTFEFADQLNCLIGGRGTGKTTVLELIRWVLDQPSTQNGRGKEAEKLERLIKTNLGSGTARAKIETAEGAIYLVERSVGEEPRIY